MVNSLDKTVMGFFLIHEKSYVIYLLTQQTTITQPHYNHSKRHKKIQTCSTTRNTIMLISAIKQQALYLQAIVTSANVIDKRLFFIHFNLIQSCRKSHYFIINFFGHPIVLCSTYKYVTIFIKLLNCNAFC